MNPELILFWIFAVCTVGAACMVILAKSPINSAMALVATFFFLAGIYVLLWAHTIAVLQVLVYAGAIMVLFLFVIMLLSLTETALGGGRVTLGKIIGGGSAAGLLAFLVFALRQVPQEYARFTQEQQDSFGSLQRMGEIVYTTYLLPFEVVSLLLLVAIVGAVVVAKPRI